MRRRDFIRGVLPMAAAPFALNGIPLRAMGQTLMTSSFTCEEVSDRAIVIIQLHGGNDGLNTLIPINQYGLYKTLRPLIGVDNVGVRKYIDLDSSLPSSQQIGLHPDLGGIKSLYDDGKVAFVQNVSYPNMNGSHFRGTDIWLTGKDGPSMTPDQDSGWWGRYLDHRFQNYPDLYPSTDMPDPPGLEFGSHIVSLGFHRKVGIPMGVTVAEDPTNFANLVASVGGALPANFPASEYGDELAFIVDVERTTNVYADRLSQVYSQGNNTVTYPETYHTNAARNYTNRLSPQLKAVARLLSGGIKTKIFLVRIGGFDTHENQAIVNKPSFGGHGCLLYHISEAVSAFQNDLKNLGLEDKVLTLTFSEFGRQVAENGTYGTDHGSSAPMMIFGKGLNGGVFGNNPNLSNLQNNRLVGYQYDYRQVLATIMQDWFGANYGTLDHVEFYEFSSQSQKLDLINSNFVDAQGNTIDYKADISCDPTPDIGPPNNPTGIRQPYEAPVKLEVWPNPVKDQAQIRITLDQLMPATLGLFSSDGKRVYEESLRLFSGENQHQFSVQHLPAGVYHLVLVGNRALGAGARHLGSAKLIIE